MPKSFPGLEEAPGAGGGLTSASEKRLFAIALGVSLGYLVALAQLFTSHRWILDAQGRPLLTDFVAIWSAGSLALEGAALTAYNGALQHAAEVAALKHGFEGQYGWPYPPSFLFVAETLARLPYGWSFAIWIGVSLGLYGLAIGAVARRYSAMIVAFAAPWTLACAIVGQNGFLTASLFGLALVTLEKRPRLSGLLLALLTYKPQFGLLIPLALAMDGRWRTMAFAVAGAVVLIGLSSAAFGPDTLTAFVQGLPHTTQTLVTNGGVGWAKLQSVYGLTRALGGSDGIGWAAQCVMTLTAAILVAVTWRSQAPFNLKAATLTAAAALSTPYIFVYDMPLLAVAVAFLYRQRRFDRWDYSALALASLTVALGSIFSTAIPLGIFASLMIAATALRQVAENSEFTVR